MSSTRHLYRSALRELRLASRQPRALRNPTVHNQLRALVRSSSSEADATRALLETCDFLRAVRVHAELLKRYNPTADMTTEERVHATARRVGLDTPIGYKGEQE
ncbi:hypothetical protein Q5752_000548 [Cryptotrichosporon argae]